MGYPIWPNGIMAMQGLLALSVIDRPQTFLGSKSSQPSQAVLIKVRSMSSESDDAPKEISEVTRRAIIDHLSVAHVSWAGRLGRCEDCARCPGASPPIRMTASWYRAALHGTAKVTTVGGGIIAAALH